MDGAPADPAFPAPAFDRLPEADGLPEIAPADLDPELLRAGILRDGCLLVRGLVPREAAEAFADSIERSFGERERGEGGGAGLVRGVRARTRASARSTTARGSRRAAACWPSTRRR